MANSISSPITPDALQLTLDTRTSDAATVALHAALGALPAVTDSPGLLRDLQARLTLGSLCLDSEIALLHVRTKAVNRIVFAVGRSVHDIAFDGDHPSIRLVVLVAVPAAAITDYLRWIAYLMRTLRSPSFKRALLEAPTTEDFRAVWSLGCERLAS